MAGQTHCFNIPFVLKIIFTQRPPAMLGLLGVEDFFSFRASHFVKKFDKTDENNPEK